MEYVELNNGVIMPMLGIGGWSQKADAILEAINIGYRLIDTAAQYGNEAEIGKAIKESGIDRKEIFLSTKLWTQDVRDHRVREAFEESLDRLETDYIDLYLIHWPAEGFEDAWLEMEKLYREGRIKAVGVSNCEEHHLDSLIENGASVIPAVNQVEAHPYFSNKEIIDCCKRREIIPEAWCPLGGPGSSELSDEKINDIADRYGKTVAQVILRWHIQNGVVIIPKSANPERMRQNIDVFDFKIADEDMTIISNLDAGRRLGPHPDKFDF